MAAIQHLCQRVVLIQAGRIEMEGNPSEVVRRHLAGFRETSNVSIREWQNRETNGQAQIVGLKAVDLTNDIEGSVVFGADLQLTIEADFYEPVRDPVFGVLIHTVQCEPILDVRSSHDGLRAGKVHGRVVVRSTVRQLGLYPGEFLLSPWITDAGCTTNIDWVKHCATLSVRSAPGPKGDLKVKSNLRQILGALAMGYLP